MKKQTLIFAAALSILSHQAWGAWPTAPALRCWSYGTESFLKAKIRPEGNGFFNISSVLVENINLKNVGNGVAYIKGDTVYLALNLVGNDQTSMWSSQNYLIINKRNLTGQSESIGHDKNFIDGSLDTEYDSSTITLTPVS
ncbi:hypothetical protein [Methyloterricola oryzae]|uniref:hypothetical protein n=1 Tax=Methyloterricola oryzae TaxID=1495050 RepID=UPI0005EACCDA|nr:hypothetical protein [Methyloterricola oryzae]